MNDGVKIKRISGRVALFLEEDATFEDACRIADQIAGVPGIARVSSGYRCAQELECMYDTAIKALSDAGEFGTFKVSARRNHTDFPIDSMQLNQLVGAALCRAFPEKSVRMKNPDVEVRVEVIQGYTYIYGRSIPGIGGLPVGSAGKAVCLLSSGIDSPVATWRIARRGATCIGVHFSGRPETSATSEYLLEDIAEVLERTGCFARLYVVPIGTYQREISAVVPPELRVIMYRRFMFKVAETIARKEGAKALVTGESLGQVASQTMDNMLVFLFLCIVLLLGLISSKLSPSLRSLVLLKSLRKMPPIAALCSCLAILRRMLSLNAFLRSKRVFLSMSGLMRRLPRLRLRTIAALRIDLPRNEKSRMLRKLNSL